MGIKVYLHIYDLFSSINYYLHPLGIGIYHTSIQINNTEYWFGGHPEDFTGVSEEVPFKNTKQFFFRETIMLGESSLNYETIRSIIEKIKDKYTGKSYNVISNNCNHFTNELTAELLNKKNIPNFLNRVAYFLQYVKCIIPKNKITFSKENSQEFNLKPISKKKNKDLSNFKYKTIFNSIEEDELL